MKGSGYWAWAFGNIVNIICWAYLAIHFNKWWIALFAILFMPSIKHKEDSTNES